VYHVLRHQYSGSIADSISEAVPCDTTLKLIHHSACRGDTILQTRALGKPRTSQPLRNSNVPNLAPPLHLFAPHLSDSTRVPRREARGSYLEEATYSADQGVYLCRATSSACLGSFQFRFRPESRPCEGSKLAPEPNHDAVGKTERPSEPRTPFRHLTTNAKPKPHHGLRLSPAR
jgi:hypothetical protein